MIISASRRTDIPAFYSDWFMNRIRSGWCQVPNPVNFNQLSYVSLKPVDVSVIVFWSRHPAPIFRYLDELDRMGFRYYFQFTLNDYPRILEPKLPNIGRRIQAFRQLASRIGPLRVVWRYDPIIISNQTSPSFHIEKFTEITKALQGSTKRVMISLVDYYRKTNRRLSYLERRGYWFDREFAHSNQALQLLEKLATIAKTHDIEIFTCAEDCDFSKVGVCPGSCIDGELIKRIWSLKVNNQKDKTQRAACRCVVSKDIGINDTCLYGCPYCYSTSSTAVARRRYSEHDPNSPVLWGYSRPLSEIERAEQLKIRLL